MCSHGKYVWIHINIWAQCIPKVATFCTLVKFWLREKPKKKSNWWIPLFKTLHKNSFKSMQKNPFIELQKEKKAGRKGGSKMKRWKGKSQMLERLYLRVGPWGKPARVQSPKVKDKNNPCSRTVAGQLYTLLDGEEKRPSGQADTAC